MSKVNGYFKNAAINWQLSWQQKGFRYKLFTILFFIALLIIFSPYFFQYIEHRKGFIFNDAILNMLPNYDMYILIFFLLWSNAFLILLAAIRNPSILLSFLTSFILLSVARALSIFLFPLEAPEGIINLTDPLSNYFYGANFITKDLFFSGHASTLFIMFLCHDKKLTKYYTLISCLCLSILLLIQHIHYSIDVIFAFPFAYLCYISAKFIISKT
jgi:hypothetical protein